MPSTSASIYVGSVGNTATFKFPTILPANGDYVATLAGVGVSDAAGNAVAGNPTINFFYIVGDINRSRSVNFDDAVLLVKDAQGGAA